MTDLPALNCHGCRKCCLGDTITLRPEEGDDVTRYKTRLDGGRRVLAKGKDGNCVYLGKRGCQIHGRQPHDCRIFDCRAYFLRYEHDDEGLRLRLQSQARESLLEGRRRVAELRRGGSLV